MVQTITFINSQDVLFGNLEATQNLIERMGDPSVKHPDLRQGSRKDHWSRSYLWKGVDSKNIISFLQSYTTPENPRVHSKIIAEFIEKMNATGGGFLTSWNVALLAEGQQNDAFEFSKSVSICSFPSRQTKGAKDLYQIGVLTDPSDESIDIDYSEWSQALLATQSEWSSDPARGRTTQVPERPSGKQLRKLRCSKASNPESSVGLLMLYPLLSSGAGKSVPDDWHDPIMGFAISFPESDAGVKVTYIGNPVLWEQEYGPSE
jgi:hypothetical protein